MVKKSSRRVVGSGHGTGFTGPLRELRSGAPTPHLRAARPQTAQLQTATSVSFKFGGAQVRARMRGSPALQGPGAEAVLGPVYKGKLAQARPEAFWRPRGTVLHLTGAHLGHLHPSNRSLAPP